MSKKILIIACFFTGSWQLMSSALHIERPIDSSDVNHIAEASKHMQTVNDKIPVAIKAQQKLPIYGEFDLKKIEQAHEAKHGTQNFNRKMTQPIGKYVDAILAEPRYEKLAQVAPEVLTTYAVGYTEQMRLENTTQDFVKYEKYSGWDDPDKYPLRDVYNGMQFLNDLYKNLKIYELSDDSQFISQSMNDNIAAIRNAGLYKDVSDTILATYITLALQDKQVKIPFPVTSKQIVDIIKELEKKETDFEDIRGNFIAEKVETPFQKMYLTINAIQNTNKSYKDYLNLSDSKQPAPSLPPKDPAGNDPLNLTPEVVDSPQKSSTPQPVQSGNASSSSHNGLSIPHDPTSTPAPGEHQVPATPVPGAMSSNLPFESSLQVHQAPERIADYNNLLTALNLKSTKAWFKTSPVTADQITAKVSNSSDFANTIQAKYLAASKNNKENAFIALNQDIANLKTKISQEQDLAMQNAYKDLLTKSKVVSEKMKIELVTNKVQDLMKQLLPPLQGVTIEQASKNLSNDWTRINSEIDTSETDSAVRNLYETTYDKARALVAEITTKLEILLKRKENSNENPSDYQERLDTLIKEAQDTANQAALKLNRIGTKDQLLSLPSEDDRNVSLKPADEVLIANEVVHQLNIIKEKVDGTVQADKKLNDEADTLAQDLVKQVKDENKQIIADKGKVAPADFWHIGLESLIDKLGKAAHPDATKPVVSTPVQDTPQQAAVRKLLDSIASAGDSYNDALYMGKLKNLVKDPAFKDSKNKSYSDILQLYITMIPKLEVNLENLNRRDNRVDAYVENLKKNRIRLSTNIANIEKLVKTLKKNLPLDKPSKEIKAFNDIAKINDTKLEVSGRFTNENLIDLYEGVLSTLKAEQAKTSIHLLKQNFNDMIDSISKVFKKSDGKVDVKTIQNLIDGLKLDSKNVRLKNPKDKISDKDLETFNDIAKNNPSYFKEITERCTNEQLITSYETGLSAAGYKASNAKSATSAIGGTLYYTLPATAQTANAVGDAVKTHINACLKFVDPKWNTEEPSWLKSGLSLTLGIVTTAVTGILIGIFTNKNSTDDQKRDQQQVVMDNLTDGVIKDAICYQTGVSSDVVATGNVSAVLASAVANQISSNLQSSNAKPNCNSAQQSIVESRKEIQKKYGYDPAVVGQQQDAAAAVKYKYGVPHYTSSSTAPTSSSPVVSAPTPVQPYSPYSSSPYNSPSEYASLYAQSAAPTQPYSPYTSSPYVAG